MSALKLVKATTPSKPPFVLKRVHIDILTNLRDFGAKRANLFDEEALDELFKARPRYVYIIPGHVQAVVDITSYGLATLASFNGKAKHS